ncbi:MAG: sodium:solute symporter [Rhodothermia bacterium]|nr:MAG: sodium:solute symporter [Rhodothermia bacterium]
MLSPLDFIVLIVYIVAVIWFGLRFSGTQESTTDYFLGGRNLSWWTVCLSIVATETSTLTVIGIPAVAFGGTLTFLQLTIGYLLGRIVVSIFFLPRYMSGDLVTAYTFLGKRFGPRLQILSSLTFIGTRLLADGVRLFATAIPLKVIADAAGLSIGYPVIIVGIGLLTIVYTYFGGLKAVVWMDSVQMILYLLAAVGSIAVLISAVDESGWSTLLSNGKLQIFNFGEEGLRSIITEPYVFWTAVIGGGVFSMASHGTDHLIVQRLLACRTLRDSQKALIGSAFIVMVQFVLFLLVGSLLWVYYGGVGISELGLSRGDEVFPKFIIDGLPPGVSGLVLAGILAAAMSTLSSSLNALASSTLMDVMSHIKRWKISPESELKASRWLTLFWGVVFMFFATLFEDLQNPVVELGLSIASFTYGALLGAFLLGMLNKRAKESDAIFSFAVSVVTMILIIFGFWLDADGGWRFVVGPSADLVSSAGLKAVAWPWFTLIGTLITVVLGSLTALRHR